MPPNVISNIQALRAFAALNVVLLHVVGTAARYGQDAAGFARLGEWGANGVDVFFVISGFIMAHTQARAGIGAGTGIGAGFGAGLGAGLGAGWEFLKRRAERIAPTYWALTALLAALVYAAPGAFRSLETSPEHILASFAFLSLATMDENPILYVGWTLEFEFLFYLIFAASLTLARPAARTVFVALVFAALFALADPRPICVEFLFGMIVAHVLHAGALTPRRGIWLLAAGGALLAASAGTEVESLRRVFVWGLPATLLVAGAAAAPQIRSRVLTFLGDASYSIYLAQVFAIPVFYKLWTAVGPAGAPGDAVALLCLAVSTLAGCATHLAVERPAARFFKARRRARLAPAPAAAPAAAPRPF